MIMQSLISAIQSSPRLRRMLWAWFYARLAKNFTERNWTFMNYGLAPGGSGAPLDLADEDDRYCIQLYERVVSPVNLTGLRVLEVGSGRGGGASYVARYHRPAHVTGADFSPSTVKLARRLHGSVRDLEFTVGDAERLPFADASFDAVINVESSHCYGHVGKFFSEVVRVLRPGGHFLFTDFRVATEMGQLEGQLAQQTSWAEVAREDITGEVVAALEADHERKRALIRVRVPRKFHSLFDEFAGLVGGKIHERMKLREILYRRFAFRRD